MKIAWLVWDYEHTETPEFCKYKPDLCFKAIQICWMEVVE